MPTLNKPLRKAKKLNKEPEVIGVVVVDPPVTQKAPKKVSPPKRDTPVNAKKAQAAVKARATGKPVKKTATSKRGRPAKDPAKNAGPKAAVEPAVVEVPTIESEHFSNPQIEFGVILQSMKDISVARSKDKLEIRYVSPRAALLLKKKASVPFRGCYTRADEVEAVLNFYRTVPLEFIPTKWERFLYPEAKEAAKVAKATKRSKKVA